MAYNIKNALVNLNEEIRKNNSGGDLPAVKLAVSQLQVSMAAVKSSVANVSAQVAQIQSTLSSISEITLTEEKVGKWGSDDLYRALITVSNPSTTTGWATLADFTGKVLKYSVGNFTRTMTGDHTAVMNVDFRSEENAGYNIAIRQYDTDLEYRIDTYTDVSSIEIAVYYTKINNQNKKGGKK